MLRLTPVVQNLLIVNAAVFVIWLLSLSAGFPQQEFMAEYFLLFKSDLLLSRAYSYFNPIQLLTWFFSHNSFYHILFNMLALASLGPIIEMVVGGKRFLRFYLFTGLMAGVLVAFVDPSDNPVLGASGAISGVLTAFAYMNPEARLRLFFVLELKAKQLAIGVALISVVFIVGSLMGRNTGNISHFGHLAGMIAAVIYFYLERVLPFLKK